MKTIDIQESMITLGQFLKVSECISTGGQAKFFLKENDVWVNHEKESRRGRKLRDGDEVTIEGFGSFKVRTSS